MAMKRTVNVCLVSGLVGILLGSVPYAVMRLNGYELTKSVSGVSAAAPEPCCEPGIVCPMTGQPKPAEPGMMGSGAAPGQDENHNPFQQDAEGKAVKSLRERLASKATAPKAETPKGSPPNTETPKVPPPAEPPKASPAKADQPKSPAKKS